MPLIKDGKIVEDRWVRLEDDADLPDDGDVIISLEQLENAGEAIKARTGCTGLALENSVEPDDIAGHLPDLDLIALDFPAFTDGRAYSQARQLRTKLGFKGELRATGNVLADQAGFMHRVGFDAFEVPSGFSLDVWNKAARSMTVAYQRGYGGDLGTRDRAARRSSSASESEGDTPGAKAALS